MILDKSLVDKFVNITSDAAIACHKFIGKNNKNTSDKAATDSMRNNLNNLNINGKVVIGEGEIDKAPMLYIGENLGTGKGPEIDIAVELELRISLTKLLKDANFIGEESYAKNPLILKPGMVFFMHMILMDSENQLAMNLGETYLIKEKNNERLGKKKLDLVIL